MPEPQPIELRMSGCMNNLQQPLDLFQKQKGEVPLMVNVDTSFPGVFKPLKTLLPLNSVAGTNLHSIFVANEVVFVCDGTSLKYLSGTSLVTLYTLSTTNKIVWTQAGNWVFFANGTEKLAIYVPTLTVCDWGQAPPAVVPVVAIGAAGNPSGTYHCYYRFRVTLPDDSIILTALSPVADITVVAQKVEWTLPAYPTFEGGTVKLDLFRTAAAFSDNYLVTTLTSPTLTYSDDLSDVTLQTKTTYDETGNYAPPDSVETVKYFPGADRVFCTVGGDAYWSEPGEYHIFKYDSTTSEYENVNSVFIGNEDILSIVQIDENLYFGSKTTWRRLRGQNPTDWVWEDTGAITGPINKFCTADMPWGILYPSTDSRLWIYSGLGASKVILDEFVFSEGISTSIANATFDSRFYHLFYNDDDYPELIVDFLKYPESTPRIVQSTRFAEASYYDKATAKFYMLDSEYVRCGADEDSEVTITITTPEIPVGSLIFLENKTDLIYKAYTAGDNLTVTPYIDGVASTALTINTNTNKRDELPLAFGDGYVLSFHITMTSSSAVQIDEPWIIK